MLICCVFPFLSLAVSQRCSVKLPCIYLAFHDLHNHVNVLHLSQTSKKPTQSQVQTSYSCPVWVMLDVQAVSQFGRINVRNWSWTVDPIWWVTNSSCFKGVTYYASLLVIFASFLLFLNKEILFLINTLFIFILLQ